MKIVIELTDKEKEMVDNSYKAIFLDVYSMMANKIKNGTPLPKGHWIYKNLKGQFCSACDKQSIWKFDYCPNCGCRMVEPQESEDKG